MNAIQKTDYSNFLIYGVIQLQFWSFTYGHAVGVHFVILISFNSTPVAVLSVCIVCFLCYTFWFTDMFNKTRQDVLFALQKETLYCCF